MVANSNEQTPRPLAVLSMVVMTLAATGCSRPVDAGCRAFQAPSRVVTGADAYSARWVDRTVEAGIRACAWGRPR